MRRLLLLVVVSLIGLGHAPALWAAACTSAATGNWSTAGTWNAPCNVVGGPTGADTVTIGATHTVTLTANAAASTLTIAAATAANGVTLNGRTLAVTGAVTMTAVSTNNITSTINVGTGTLTAASIAINGGANNRVALMTVSTGSITTTGSITFGGTAANARFTSTGAGTVTIRGNFGNGGTLTTGGTGTFNFAGGAAQTIGTYTTYNNIRINNTAGGVTLTGTTTFGGTLQVQTGTLAVGFALTVTGATTVSSTLQVTSTTGTKNFDGDVTINNGGTFATTVNEAINYGGDVTINNGGTLTEFNGGAAMSFAGSLQNNGTYTAGTGAHTFSGTGQTISGTNTISIPSVTVSGTYTNQNTLTISTALAGGGTLTNGDATHANAVLNIGDTGIAAGLTLDASATGNTVNYNLNGNQTVKAPSGGDYFNLTLSTGGNKTLPGGTLNILGDLTIGTGATCRADTNDPDVFLSGDFSNSGGFTSGSGLFTFTGTAAQTWAGTSATTIINLTFDKSSNGVTITSAQNQTVSGTLRLTNGTASTTGAAVLAVSNNAAAAVIRTNGYVIGNLRRAYPTSAGAVSRTFDVGTSSSYAPVDVNFASISVAGSLTVSSTAGEHPNISTSGIDPSFALQRYWTLTNVGITFTSYSATFTFNNPGDLDTDSAPLNFIVQRFSGGAWNATTIGTRTTTTTQITGVTAFGDFQIGEGRPTAGSSSFNAVEVGGTILSNIRTKVAGVSFSLDLVALNAARNALNTSFKGAVTVEVLNASNNAGGFDANGCKAGWTVIQSFSTTFTAAEAGRHTTSFTENNIFPDARIRVKYAIAGTDLLIGCSVDNFAIRPSTFTAMSATDLDWQTAYTGTGTPRNLTNVAASGGVVHKAGQPFTVNATAVNFPGTTMTTYSGSPVAVVSAVVQPALCGTCSTGSLTFTSWSAVSGTVTSSNATFTEAGSVTIRLEDQSYANVDASDGISTTTDRYVVGPNFNVGRFVPDHFTFTGANTPALQTFGSSCATRSFTYIGQTFWYPTASLPAATIEARNSVSAGDTITTNYRGTLYKLATSGIGESYSNNSIGPALNVGSAVSPPQLTPGNGTGAYKAAASATNVTLSYARSTATPSAPFTANISLTVTASDSSETGVTGNGTITQASSLVFNGGGTGIGFDSGSEFRYGRLRLLNSSGPTTADIPITLRAEYYVSAATGFALNNGDSCTPLAAGNFKLSGHSGSLTTGNMPDSNVSAPATLTSGIASGMKLLKPTSTATGPGVVRVCFDLDTSSGVGDTTCQAASSAANRAYLQGPWSGAGTYDKDPIGQVNVGTFGAQPNNFIFFRENY